MSPKPPVSPAWLNKYEYHAARRLSDGVAPSPAGDAAMNRIAGRARIESSAGEAPTLWRLWAAAARRRLDPVADPAAVCWAPCQAAHSVSAVPDPVAPDRDPTADLAYENAASCCRRGPRLIPQ